MGNPTVVSSFLLVEVLEGGLVHIFLADVENQVDLLLCSDLFDQGLHESLPLQIFRVNVDASLALDNIDDLELPEHVLKVGLKLLSLPIAKLFIRLLVAKGDRLVSFYH